MTAKIKKTAKAKVKAQTGAPKKKVVKGAKAATPSKAASAGAAVGPAQVLAPEADDTWTPLGNEVGIRVRMYRVGFGDFFLLTYLQDKDHPVHIIIDCGVFKGTSGTGDLGSISDAVSNMARVTGGKVALIIVTHRHADHIAGFARCSDTFAKLQKVEAIWMSVWESQYPAVVKYQAQLTSAASDLQAHFNSLTTPSDDVKTAKGFMGNAVGEGGGNAKALSLLNGGIGGVTPQFYQAGQAPTLPASFVSAGITAQILGPPPVADIAQMKLMDLRKGVDQYLAAVSAAALAGDAEQDGDAAAPFSGVWQVAANEGEVPEGYAPECFSEWMRDDYRHAETLADTPGGAAVLMQKALTQAQPDAALVAAAQLNSFLNNQSLVVLFTIKGKKLLFVGDAQAGNWKHWTYGTDDASKDVSGAMTTDAQAILTSLDFYKVGHHGSGNATPKAVVGAMGKGNRKFAAMCSTEKGVYGRENLDPSLGTEVPRLPLMNDLGGVASLVRSDQLAITLDVVDKAGAVRKVDKPAMVAGALPAAAGGSRFAMGRVWIDCYL